MIDNSNKNFTDISNWFYKNGLEPCISDDIVFEIYKDICYYGKITESTSIKDRIRVMKLQLSFIRKNIIGVMYNTNGNSSKGIKEGYVYAIHNPAWGDYVKIGSSIDVYDRLNTYQTSSPFRDYELIGYVYSPDRFKLEKDVRHTFDDKNSEWVKTDKATIKRHLKSFESFPENSILDFCVKETIIAIGKSESVKFAQTDREKVKMFYKTVKHCLHYSFPWMKNKDVFSSNSIIKIDRYNNIWSSNSLKIDCKVIGEIVEPTKLWYC